MADYSLDRRHLLGAGALTLGALNVGLPDLALAQPAAAAVEPGGKKLAQRIAEFIAGFDLKVVPPEVIDRARTAFSATIGVMLAGSQEAVAQIAVEMMRAEARSELPTTVACGGQAIAA